MSHFIHAIDLSDPYACHNLIFTNCLYTPNAVAAVEPAIGSHHRSISDISIESLAKGDYPQTVITPRAVGQLIRPAIIRQGLKIANGFNEVETISKETQEEMMDCSDVEILFESKRREVAPHSPSRLSCLFLAEQNNSSEQMLRKMLGRNVYIIRVVIIKQLSIAKVDSAWFDDYFESRNIENIEKYWQGIEMHNGGRWEYLLDGAIQIIDPKQIEYIKKHGTLPI